MSVRSRRRTAPRSAWTYFPQRVSHTRSVMHASMRLPSRLPPPSPPSSRTRCSMQRRVRSLVTLIGAAATALVAAQCGTSTAAPDAAGTRTMGLVADHGLADLIHDVSPAQIRATDSALVAFGTRHTLSDTTSDTRGIGAARRY